MFGNQEELFKQIPNHLLVNLIGCNYLHESIISSCMDISDGDYIGRLRVISLINIDQLIYKNSTQQKDITYGLLNLEWIKKTINFRPATVILVYDVRNKSESVSWKDFENSIFNDITKVKKIDNYSFFNMIILLFTNSQSFSFDYHNDDKERSYNIKKIIDPKNIYYFNGVDGIKGFAKKFSTHIVKLSVNYYRTIKKNLKMKKSKSFEIKEKLIKYNIKLGIISQIKNKKKNWKYFDEAFTLLANIDIKNYFFGSNNYLFNYIEIKSVADWLFFKVFYLKIYDLNNNIQSIVNSFNFYVNYFSKVEFYTQNEDAKDEMIIIEYYWRILKFEFISKFLEDNGKSEFYAKSCLNFPGYHFLVNN